MNEVNGKSYISIDVLQNMFETVLDEYKKKFEQIYGFNPHDCYWTGHVLTAADYFLDFYDVVYAVNKCVHENELFEWYDYNLTLGEFSLGKINLENYVKGKRPYRDNDIKELRELQSKFNKIKSDIDDLVFRIKNGC